LVHPDQQVNRAVPVLKEAQDRWGSQVLLGQQGPRAQQEQWGLMVHQATLVLRDPQVPRDLPVRPDLSEP